MEEELIPLNEYCDWLEILTEEGHTIDARGLQETLEKYINQKQNQ